MAALFKKPDGVAVLSLRICLCWLRARNCGLDFEISFRIPRLRSAHYWGGGRFLVLGNAHCGMLHRYVAFKNLRQPQNPNRLLLGRIALFDRGSLWSGAGFA